MTLPNFLIIGAMRAGTTSLVDALGQHPEVVIPTKEPHFFSYEGKTTHIPKITTTIAEYQALFEGKEHVLARGDASPAYLPDRDAPERIHHYIPDVKMIAVLRDPVDRAYSNFYHEVKIGCNPADNFTDAIRINDELAAQNKLQQWATYTYQGLYFKHLTRYYKLFDASQIKVFLYEDWCQQPQVMLRAIYEYLGIDADFEAGVDKYGRSGELKHRGLHEFFLHPPPALRWIVKKVIPARLNQTRQRVQRTMMNAIVADNPTIDSDVEKKLRAFYREDILHLQQLIRRDLSKWLGDRK